MNIYKVKFDNENHQGLIIPTFIKRGVTFIEYKHKYGISVGELSPYEDHNLNETINKLNTLKYKLEKSIYSLENIKVLDDCETAVESQICADYISKRSQVPLWKVYSKYLGSNAINKGVPIYASGCSADKDFRIENLDHEINKAKVLGANIFKFRMPVDGSKSHEERVSNPDKADISKIKRIGEYLQNQGFKVAIDLGCRLRNTSELKEVSEIAKWVFVEEPFNRRSMNNSIGLNVAISGGEHCKKVECLNKYRGKLDNLIFQPDMNMIALRELKKCIEARKTDIISHNWTTPISCVHNYSLSIALKTELIEFPVTRNPYYAVANIEGYVSNGIMKQPDGLIDIAWSRLRQYSHIITEGSSNSS